MKFGVREICDVVFKANQSTKIGSKVFRKGKPVLYIDSANTSTIEGTAATSYATGGKGNARLIAWEGEKTLTFTVEDALLSPIGFAVLSGAGLFDETDKNYQVHCTALEYVTSDNEVNLDDVVSADAPIFVMEMKDGSFVNIIDGVSIKDTANDGAKTTLTIPNGYASKQVFIDYYVTRTTGVTELQIDAENFAGYYYVEASTLFRRESDGKDLPAEIVFPRVKVQSNFTFTMSSSGDPSTFTFTMDALPGYTMFEKTKKVLCAMQVIEEEVVNDGVITAVTTLETDEPVEEYKYKENNKDVINDSRKPAAQS